MVTEAPIIATRRTALVLVAAGHVLITAVMTWPYVNYDAFAASTYGGDQRLIVWTLAWANHATLTGASLFDSNIFFPAADSLRYNEHLFGVSLFTLPWAAAGASPVLAHNVVWWLAFPLNGVCSFLLLRRFVDSALAAFAGSVAFTYSFYVMSHAHGHLHLIWLWTIPLSLVAFERWFVNPSWGRLFAWTVTLLLALLTSWYVAVFALIATGGFAATLMLDEARAVSHTQSPEERWSRRGVQLSAAILLCVLCVYPFARHYVGIESQPGEVIANSADIASYLVPPLNTVPGQWWRDRVGPQPREIWGERTLFAGWTALAVAVAGLGATLRSARSWRSWFLPGLAGLAALLSFGPVLPGLGETSLSPFSLLSGLPGLDGLRAPARFAALAMLGLGGLVASGLQGTQLRMRRGGTALGVVLIPLMLFEWRVVDFPAGKPAPHAIPAIYRAPELQSARALVSLPEYHGLPDWFLGGDYLYYSTVHWRPILNGFGRTEPLDHARLVGEVRGFPESAPRLRGIGLQYVVVHAARFDEGPAMVARALDHPDCRLVARTGTDYLFEIR